MHTRSSCACSARESDAFSRNPNNEARRTWVRRPSHFRGSGSSRRRPRPRRSSLRRAGVKGKSRLSLLSLCSASDGSFAEPCIKHTRRSWRRPLVRRRCTIAAMIASLRGAPFFRTMPILDLLVKSDSCCPRYSSLMRAASGTTMRRTVCRGDHCAIAHRLPLLIPLSHAHDARRQRRQIHARVTRDL